MLERWAWRSKRARCWRDATPSDTHCFRVEWAAMDIHAIILRRLKSLNWTAADLAMRGGLSCHSRSAFRRTRAAAARGPR